MTPFEREFLSNIHESGHGLVAEKCGIHVEFITAYSHATKQAGTKFCTACMERQLTKAATSNDVDAFRTRLTAHAAAAMGGALAEGLFAGDINWRKRMSDSDWQYLNTMKTGINRTAGGDAFYKCTDASLDKIAALWREFLSKPLMLNSLRRIAAELKSRGQLNQSEIRGLIRISHGQVPEGLRELVE